MANIQEHIDEVTFLPQLPLYSTITTVCLFMGFEILSDCVGSHEDMQNM